MTIASCSRDIIDLINIHSVYGVETVLNALARSLVAGCAPITTIQLHEMIDDALRRAYNDYKEEL